MLTRAIGRAARAKPGRAVAQVSPRASEFITWSDTSNRWYTSVIGPPRHRHAFHGNPYQLGVASSSRTGYAGWYVGKGKEVDTRPVQGHSRSVQVLYGGEGAGKDARRVQEPSNSSNNAYGTRQQTRLFHFSTTALRGEGKGPDTRLVQACQGPSYSADAHGAGLQRRRFHSSARRDALPLIPAGAAILKVSPTHPQPLPKPNHPVNIPPRDNNHNLSNNNIILPPWNNRRFPKRPYRTMGIRRRSPANNK